jgi:hypothetical protein
MHSGQELRRHQGKVLIIGEDGELASTTAQSFADRWIGCSSEVISVEGRGHRERGEGGGRIRGGNGF